MDREIIERFLTNAGRSYFRSPEFEQERASFRAAGVDFDPCAQFGIGFMSCFMLGDHIVIHTRRDYGPSQGQGTPLIVEINGLGGIVVIRQGAQDQPVGTTIEITGRRKPRFLDEFVDQVKLVEVIQGYALACEFPIEARCYIPEIADDVTIPAKISEPRTELEDSDIKNYVTIEQQFSEVHPLLDGCARVSFIVDENKCPTLRNSEAVWDVISTGKFQGIKLVNTEGKEIEEHFPRRENQICLDGILVSGHPGRDDLERKRRYWTIGHSGPPSETVGDRFEIVCGVRRYEMARERGMRRVPAVVREMTTEEAIQYAVEDNLFAAGCSASLTLPQAIFLSRLLEGRGRNFPPRLVWELARVSESTFWRAVKSFDLAVSKAADEHPELNEMEEHRRVAEILRRDLFPEFTRLWTGSLEVHTFQQAHATGDGHGIAARKKSMPTKAKRANGTRRASAAPEPADGHLSRGSAKRSVRSKDERADENLLLFER
jgi:hypothetical protein